MADRHEMMLVHTDVTGAETWQCRECDYRILLKSWVPFVREVVREGDDVPHTGAKAPDGVELDVGAKTVDDDPAPEWWPW